MILEALRWSQVLAAVGILALLIRTAQILSSGAIQDVSVELLYLRLGDLRWPGILVLTAGLLEVAEFLYPKLTSVTAARTLSAWGEAVNGLQALLLLAATILVFLRVREYTAPGQRRHVESALNSLAERRGPRAPAPAPDTSEDEEEEE